MILPILRMIFSTLLGVVFKKISEGSCSRNFKIFGSGWGRHFFAKKSRNFGAYSMLLLIRFFLKGSVLEKCWYLRKNKSLSRVRDFYFNLSAKNCVHVITVEMVVEKPRICNASSQTIVVTCVLVNNDAPKNKTKETTNTMIIQLIT